MKYLQTERGQTTWYKFLTNILKEIKNNDSFQSQNKFTAF